MDRSDTSCCMHYYYIIRRSGCSSVLHCNTYCMIFCGKHNAREWKIFGATMRWFCFGSILALSRHWGALINPFFLFFFNIVCIVIWSYCCQISMPLPHCGSEIQTRWWWKPTSSTIIAYRSLEAEFSLLK